MKIKTQKIALMNGSKIIIESCVRSGADVFVGYPITPSNWLYAYAKERFPLSLSAPDEITALQWLSGFSAAGKIPVTATSFPGFALMIETINMAYMMELPLLIILSQRMGPSTGSATTGAQGDLMLLRGCISGGYPLPVFCPSSFEDCWELAHQSIAAAVNLRSPVILLTSKEMVMTNKSFNLSGLPEIDPIKRESKDFKKPFKPYLAGKNLVPPFMSVNNSKYQVRINASTHNNEGMIEKASPEALANSKRLKDKIEKRIAEFTFYDLDEDNNADKLIVSYGISVDAVRDAVKTLREDGKKVSLLIIKTLLPVPPAVIDILNRYKKLLFVEENLPGLLKEIIFGIKATENISSINKIGSMIAPSEIVNEWV